MTLLDDLDRMHAASVGSRHRIRAWHYAIDRNYPTLRAYVKALEAERDASRASLVIRNGGVYVAPRGASVLFQLDAARLATDAAREAMEKRHE